MVNAASVHEVPETAMVAYQAKPNQEELLLNILKKHWQVAQQLNLIRASPYALLRDGFGDKHFIVEIFTWRDASIP